MSNAAEFRRMQARIAKEVSEGEKVTHTGYLTSAQEKLGRSLMIELNEPYGKGFRLVDHRTIEELIVKGVRYSLK